MNADSERIPNMYGLKLLKQLDEKNRGTSFSEFCKAHGYSRPTIPNPHVRTIIPDGPCLDADIVIEFDGGSRNLNYSDHCSGDGYGSYRISEYGFPYGIERVTFEGANTSNASECLTLVRALLRAQTLCDPGKTHVHIIGDSNNTLLKVHRPSIKSTKVHPSYRLAVGELAQALLGWSRVTTQWRSRRHSVSLFGH